LAIVWTVSSTLPGLADDDGAAAGGHKVGGGLAPIPQLLPTTTSFRPG